MTKKATSQQFKPLITKEAFVKYLNTLKEKRVLWDNFRTSCSKLSPDFYFDFYPEGEYESIITNLLSLFFPHEMEDIDYFCFELNYGEDYKPGAITYNGEDVDFSSPAALYDFLIRQEEDAIKNKKEQ